MPTLIAGYKAIRKIRRSYETDFAFRFREIWHAGDKRRKRFHIYNPDFLRKYAEIISSSVPDSKTDNVLKALVSFLKNESDTSLTGWNILNDLRCNIEKASEFSKGAPAHLNDSCVDVIEEILADLDILALLNQRETCKELILQYKPLLSKICPILLIFIRVHQIQRGTEGNPCEDWKIPLARLCLDLNLPIVHIEGENKRKPIREWFERMRDIYPDLWYARNNGHWQKIKSVISQELDYWQ